MRKINSIFGAVLGMAIVLTSCGEYNRVLKSSDYNYKYTYAKEAYEKGKYTQAYTILEDIVTVF